MARGESVAAEFGHDADREQIHPDNSGVREAICRPERNHVGLHRYEQARNDEVLKSEAYSWIVGHLPPIRLTSKVRP